MEKTNLFSFELEPGMVLAEDIRTVSGQLLAATGTVLDTTAINTIRSYNIPMIAIEVTPANVASEEALTYSEKIRSSESFKEFKQNYIEDINHFQNSINDIVQKNAPINPSELLSKTTSLVQNTSSSLELFDMLHNMREFDDSTFAHCLNVALICRVFGQWLNMDQEDIDALTVGGMLHDIGKLTTPESILTKPGKLTTEEFSIMKNHAINGFNILKDQNLDPRIKEACLFHHERVDGTGYPYGIKGDRIPDFAKITSIADVYDAMTAKRVYRGAVCPFIVIRYIESDGYSKYDPRFLLPFLKNVVSSYMNTTVQLSDGRIGEVVMINQHSISRPIVHSGNDFIDLSKNTNLDITAII